VKILEGNLLVLVTAQRPELLAEMGCGTLTAAELIGRTAGAERFRTDASELEGDGVRAIAICPGSSTPRWPLSRPLRATS
jgi:hypothetical protein